ncbi:hypothetical protein M1437_02890 [Patescibacteria group bacterium]|nr:hypothetical protein [Patescibacteria group bacterium]
MAIKCETSRLFGLIRETQIIQPIKIPKDPDQSFRYHDEVRALIHNLEAEKETGVCKLPPNFYILDYWERSIPLEGMPYFTPKTALYFDIDEATGQTYASMIRMMYGGTFEWSFWGVQDQEINFTSRRDISGIKRHYWWEPN